MAQRALSHSISRTPSRWLGVLCGVVLAVGGVLSLTSCSGEGVVEIEDYQNLPGGNPLVPEVAAFPFPSDFYLAADATTATGRRVSMTDAIMPRGVQASVFREDGYTIIPSILAYLPGGTDVASLPSPTDHAQSVADDSSVFLVREDTWERVGVLAELDQTTDNLERQAIILRPLRALDYNTGYVVILRNSLRRLDGTPHEASPVFEALRDGRRTRIPEIEAQRESFELVNAAIAGTGLEPQEVVLAWSFHTRSEAAVTDPLVRMQLAANTAPIGDYAITEDEVRGLNRQLAGTMDVPNFIDPDTQRVVLDAEGEPMQFGVREVPFVLTIPLVVDEPRPLLIYGHGFLGARTQTTGGSVNALCQDYRMSAAGVNFGFHEGVVARVTAAFAGNWDGLNEVVSEVQQTFVDSSFLARLVRERLAAEVLHDPMNGDAPYPLIDPNNVHYMGISNGGTFGYVMAATSPQIRRAVLVVGGGGLIHFLQRATQWNQFGVALSLLIRDPIEQQLAFSLAQQVLDPVDSMNYMHHLVRDRYEGMQPLRASIHMAIHDSQVNNLVTEWAMRSGDIPVVVPSPKDIWDLRTVSADASGVVQTDDDGVMHVYDEMVTPSPITNVPPATDNGTHGTVRDLISYKTQVGRFLTEDIFVHACDGACDPN